MASSVDDKKIASELRGNTLRAYWALLGAENGVMGVRELQRKLGFSSPALASYHLRKLEDLGLVIEERGDYKVLREIKVGILEQFIKLGTFMLPRYVFYATLFTTLLIFFISQLKELNFYSLFGLIFGILGTLILWYEAVRILRQKP
jgi:DNA-binding transcriptional ArsR family regulator